MIETLKNNFNSCSNKKEGDKYSMVSITLGPGGGGGGGRIHTKAGFFSGLC